MDHVLELLTGTRPTGLLEAPGIPGPLSHVLGPWVTQIRRERVRPPLWSTGTNAMTEECTEKATTPRGDDFDPWDSPPECLRDAAA